jgi:putative peptidoglycan lipid II flippase
VGIIALVWIKILAPAFYAQQDTKTPVKIGIRVLLITQLFNLFFVLLVFDRYAYDFRHAALALSTSLGAVLNAWWLYRGLLARGVYVPQPGWARFAWQLFGATLFTTALILLAKPADLWWTVAGEIPRASLLAALFALGGFAYLGVLYCLGFRLRDVHR